MEQTQQEILERFESDLYKSSDKVKKDRLHYAKKWLDFAGQPPWHRDKVVEFIEHYLKDQNYSDGTRAKVYGIVKRVFDAALAVAIEDQQKMIAQMDIAHPQESIILAIKALGTRLPSWEMGKKGAPDITETSTPTLDLEGLKLRIEAVKDDGIGAGFLALSSIYGLRRGELQRVRPEDFDWSAPTLFVHTEKGGDQRKQLLASEIVPLLKGCDFSRQYSDFEMSKIWWNIERKAGITHELDTGFHSVRRYLDTALRDIWGQNSIQVKIFFRWKTSSSSEMQDRYYHKDPLIIDREVLYKGHPIVTLWGNSNASQSSMEI